MSNSKQDDTRKPSLGERLKELAERLGEVLDDLTRPAPEPVLVPVRPRPSTRRR